MPTSRPHTTPALTNSNQSQVTTWGLRKNGPKGMGNGGDQ